MKEQGRVNVIDMGTFNRLKKPSDRLKEIQRLVGLKNVDMAAVLNITEQMYELYISGKFNSAYGIRQERLLARAIFLHEEIDKKIQELQEAKERFKNYGKPGRKSQAPGDNGTADEAPKKHKPRKHKNPKNYGKKNGNTPTLKRQNLNGKGAKQKNLRSL